MKLCFEVCAPMNEIWTDVSDGRGEGVSSRGQRPQRFAREGLIRKAWVPFRRAISIPTVVVFGLMALEPWNFAQAAQQAPRAVRAGEVSGPEHALARLDGSLRSARNLAVRLDAQAAREE